MDWWRQFLRIRCPSIVSHKTPNFGTTTSIAVFRQTLNPLLNPLGMTTSLPWHPLLSSKTQRFHPSTNKLFPNSPRPNSIRVQAFRRSDFDGFAKRMASGEAWRDAWRSANNGFEQILYETKKTAERIDRQYSVGRRLSSVAQSASDRARELDRDYLITQRWRTFTLDFSQNWPRVCTLFLYLFLINSSFIVMSLAFLCYISFSLLITCNSPLAVQEAV